MESWQWIALVGVVVVGIVGLIVVAFLALALFALALSGAGLIFVFAASQGFVGIIAFFAAWVFLFPIMFIWAIIWGWLAEPVQDNSKVKKRKLVTDRSPPRDPDEFCKWANRLPPYEDE